jgi:predicted tellurium resistance membrane protein TerC
MSLFLLRGPAGRTASAPPAPAAVGENGSPDTDAAAGAAHRPNEGGLMFDLSIFMQASTWITLITLIFLEIVLGIDNIVFISITSDRLPPEKQHIGRKLGLAGAFVSRVIFLSVASWLTSMTAPLFTLDLGPYVHGFSVRDIILLVGGGYLVYKGIDELRDVLALTEIKEEHLAKKEGKPRKHIGLAQAVGIIMAMDVVFSIDSVITAVGLSDHLIIMILAVMIAIILMMVFIDPISNFINKHTEMKILALVFITAIGVLLVLDAVGVHSGIEVLDMSMEKMMVYFAMAFSVVLELIQMRFNSNFERWSAEQQKHAQLEPEVEAAVREKLEASKDDGADSGGSAEKTRG